MYRQAAILFALVVSFVVADHHIPYKVCVSNVAACNNAGLTINVTCQGATSGSTCIKDVVNGQAVMTLASADDMVKYADNLQIVIGQKLPDLYNFIQYYGLAVVKKNTTFNFNSLRNQKSCHTGVKKTVGWKIPVGYMLFNKIMTYTDNQYKSASDFFGQSCAPGINDIPGVSDAVKRDLCSLCNGSCAQDSSTEAYYSYEGAFKCMADGNNDRVGFVRESTAENFFSGKSDYRGTTMADYELLCPNGTKAALNQYKTCYIGTRPLYAIVTGKSTSSETITRIQNMLLGVDVRNLTAAGIAYKM
ncbi:serotransferrin-like isoform X1 [Xenia sp. Carnegie-2017]|uniref:serotransferrin-like isoform X1 n=1 Tax=Xenia sp. Carnegie-2017 TaxID=2897299 RepID=UPI001F03FDB3|nr:serotransferrin-like isoform X1 [Xenia sp. Carnegie-2017]